ncbi:hypothetical protein BKI52_28890 [marine bacterium AO1-C]|nr:hypothetical protein BKI52_28890 [marine bacterium AO1-C]
MKKLMLLIGLIFCLKSLHAQKKSGNLSNKEKIYGLSKVWKEADKNFVFFDQVPDLDWDKAYQEFIPKILATNSTYEYYKQLQAFCSLLRDGHTRVNLPRKLRETYEATAPIKTTLVDGKVFITGVLNDTLKQQGLQEGMEIVGVNGLDVHKYVMKNIKPFVFYSTPQDMETHLYDYAFSKGPIDQPLRIKTSKNKQFSISRKLSKSNAHNPTFSFRVLDNNIGYLKISRFWGKNVQAKFDSIYPDVKKVKKLIIDVSENEGGNSNYAHYVLQHFVAKSFETSRWKTLMYLPAYASWGWNTQWQDNSGDIIKPLKESRRFTKPVVVLISEKTYSAGEDFVSAFLNTKRGVVIGRPTAGTTGNPIGFKLPAKGWVQICSKRDYLSNGKEFVGYGIAPNKVIKKTKNKNHLIEAAVKELKGRS